MPDTRRNFIKNIPYAVGGAVVAGAGSAGAKERFKPFGKRKSPTDERLIKIGAITCSQRHHLPHIWGYLFNPITYSDFTWSRTTGMVMTHVWDINTKRSKMLQDEYGTKPVKNYDDMVDKVDGILVSSLESIDYFPELIEPYLKAGMPVFVNRPFASSMGDAMRMVEMSKRYNTPIMSGSSLEYVNEVYVMKRLLREAENPIISGINAHNSSTDYTNHAIHGIWMVMEMFGGGIEYVSAHLSNGTPFSHHNLTILMKYKARGEKQPPFFACVQNCPNPITALYAEAITNKGNFRQEVWCAHDHYPYRYFIFVPMLLMFQRMIEFREMPQTHEFILEKTAVFIAGYKSFLEKGGAPVCLDEIEDDWRADCDLVPETYPEGFFK